MVLNAYATAGVRSSWPPFVQKLNTEEKHEHKVYHSVLYFYNYRSVTLANDYT